MLEHIFRNLLTNVGKFKIGRIAQERRPHRTNARKNVIVGLPANLITLNLKSAFIFAVNQNVAKFEILHGYDSRAVIQNILQSLFTRAKRLFYPLVFADLSR
jgi:hypothetical protein